MNKKVVGWGKERVKKDLFFIILQNRRNIEGKAENIN